MLVIGLTGGIGSGKSTVAQCFARLGAPVIDADVIARELVEPGKPALARIVETFGAGVLNQDGSLNRARLRSIVFSDVARRRQLEAILHPLIQKEMEARVVQLSAPYCVLCIPLLLETGQARRVQRILVVDAPHYLQYRRVMARDGLSAAEVAAVLRAQMRFRERLARADDIIVNDRDVAHVQRQVERLHRLYGELAAVNKK
ncbi:MAG: dephospho-CoA kinase [Pseudomonadota bacterium]